MSEGRGITREILLVQKRRGYFFCAIADGQSSTIFFLIQPQGATAFPVQSAIRLSELAGDKDSAAASLGPTALFLLEQLSLSDEP